MRRAGVFWPLLVVFAACSSSGSTGGGAGAGGTSASGGASGSGGQGCPASGPLRGGACTSEGKRCTSGDPCPCVYACRRGVWTQEGCAGCAEPDCPTAPPTEGSSCAFMPQRTCTYDDCTGVGRIVARCEAQAWILETAMCPRACGADAGVAPCGPGQVCVEKHHVVGPSETVSYDCAPNPCAAGATSCSCAESLCAGDPTLYCASASEERVTCGSNAQ